MSVPTTPGVYEDRFGNVWKLWGDGLFKMLSSGATGTTVYAPFVRLVPEPAEQGTEEPEWEFS